MIDTPDPAQAFEEQLRAIDAERLATIGPGLLTINLRMPSAPSPDTIVLQRVWTSDPQAYPVSGRKTKRLTPWTRQLLIRAEPYLAEGDAALAEIFDDHARIIALGLHASINLPLCDAAGFCFATFNLLVPEPTWSPDRIAMARRLAAQATPAVAALRDSPDTCPPIQQRP